MADLSLLPIIVSQLPEIFLLADVLFYVFTTLFFGSIAVRGYRGMMHFLPHFGLRVLTGVIAIVGGVAIRGFFPDLGTGFFQLFRADVIVGGLDSMNARLNLNAQAVRFKKPLIDGGTSGYHGHVYTVFPYENACYECNPLPVGESDEMAACTVVGIPRKRIHCVFKGNMAFQEKYDKNPNPKNEKHVKFVQDIANGLAQKHERPCPA